MTHTTGFIPLFGVEYTRVSLAEAVGVFSAPLFLLLGVMLTSYVVDLPTHRNERPDYRWPSALIVLCLFSAVLLAELGLFGAFGERLALGKDYAFLELLSLASGLQNALFTTASGVVVRTTHLTGTTTELGVSLTRLLLLRNSDEASRRLDQRASLRRLGLFSPSLWAR